MHSITSRQALLLSVIAAAVGILIAAMLTFAPTSRLPSHKWSDHIRRSRLLFQQT
jgi:hypothetical protein